MRVEDLDRPRARPGLARRQLDELAWLGLDWDQPPLYQSQRGALYDDAIEKLTAAGHVYQCFCSRSEIAAASAPHQGEETRYPGTCANLSSSEREGRRRAREPSLRLRVPAGPVEFTDEILGPQRFDPQVEVGDFVLRRADGIHAYQLAVVVDDAASAVTQVLRGADLLSSTARQILLYRLLGLAVPRFAHAPLVLGPAGERLSKRHRAVSLSALKAAGVDPRQLIAQLASISGLQAGPLGCTPIDLVATFAPGRISRGPALVPVPLA